MKANGELRSARGGLLVGLCALCAACAPAAADDDRVALDAVRADEARRVAAFERAARAVVCVFADRRATRGGSGVVIDEDGYGLTNFHVVADLLDSRRGFGGLSDGRLYPLKLLGIDPGGDIALFKLEGRQRFAYAPLGDSDQLRVGQWVAAMGNPFLLAEDFAPTITLGVISGLHRYQVGQGQRGRLLEYADCIQVSTSINPGNSGGPLFDLGGRVIGINGRASFDDGQRGRVNVGLGYAVSINQVRRFLPALRAGRLCAHGTLGATVRRAGQDLIFGAIQELSAAERAGIRLGDELLALVGRPVRTPNDVSNALAVFPANWPISITVRRDGVELTTAARLDRLPVRMPAPYVLDLEHNRGEIRRLFARSRAPGPGPALPPQPWRCRLSRTAGGETIATELIVACDTVGTLAVRRGDAAAAFSLGRGSFVADGDLPPAESWRNRAVWSEWQHILAPFLGAEIIGAGWELLDGDEVQGRIASIVAWRVAEGRQVRWAFDYESGRPLEARVFDSRQPGAVLWLPEGPPAPDSSRRRWVRKWTRHANGADSAVFAIEVLDVGDGP